MEKALKVFHERYARAERAARSQVLDEFCRATRYHRKYAIVLLNQPWDEIKTPGVRRRGPTYSAQTIRVLYQIWKAGGYPWSQRLKALLPLWLPWARGHVFGLTDQVEEELQQISARQIDRRLRDKKRTLKRRLYGRTKPGTLLKHHIPIKTDQWDVTEPGFTEIDLVSHSGDCASGEFVYSLNLTDIYSGWGETRAVMGRGETGVVEALEALRGQLPFALRGIDSDNGTEFINGHLYRYCQDRRIQFTRGRPYKKDDNAHIEQKNWTQVRKIFGYDRYDTPDVLQAMNDLYQHELRLMMNWFQPSVKLAGKVRVGARLRRRYDTAQTPLDRLVAFYHDQPLPQPVQALLTLRAELDPFDLAAVVERKLESIERLRRHCLTPKHTVLSLSTGSPRGASLGKETPHASLQR